MNPRGSSDGKMNDIQTVSFNAKDYIGWEVYVKDNAQDTYTYVGKIVWGSQLPDGYVTQNTEAEVPVQTPVQEVQEPEDAQKPEIPSETPSGSVSGNDAVIQIAEEPVPLSVSGNDAGAPVTTVVEPVAEPAATATAGADIANNLYVLNTAGNTAKLWAEYNKANDTYTLTPVTDGYFLQFKENASGEYYISGLQVASGEGDYKLTDIRADIFWRAAEACRSICVGKTIMTATTAMILSEMTGKTHWIRFIITAASRTKSGSARRY